jgi:cephalosporin-C deacetylase-like acetyl esterase
MLFIARPPYKPRRGEDWREVATYFSNHSSKDEIIFSQLAWFHTYYFTKTDHAVPVDQNVSSFEDIVNPSDQLWLMKNNRYTGGWPVNGLRPEQQLKIDNEFVLEDSVTFKQTTAYFYKRKQ